MSFPECAQFVLASAFASRFCSNEKKKASPHPPTVTIKKKLFASCLFYWKDTALPGCWRCLMVVFKLSSPGLESVSSHRRIREGAWFLIPNLAPFRFFSQSLCSMRVSWCAKWKLMAFTVSQKKKIPMKKHGVGLLRDIVAVPRISDCWLFCLSCSRRFWAEGRRRPGTQRRPRPPGLLSGPPAFVWTSGMLCGERDRKVHTFFAFVLRLSDLGAARKPRPLYKSAFTRPCTSALTNKKLKRQTAT